MLAEGTEDTSKVEEKYKLSILNLEKKFIDLETVIGDLNEKLKDLNLENISDLQQKVEDLEDLIMVEQAGIIELKKLLEEKKEVTPAAVSISPEELEKITSVIEERWEGRILSIEKRLSSLQIPKQTIDITKLQSQIQTVANELAILQADVNNQINQIKERSGLVGPGMIQSIVSEVSDLRVEMDKKIREVKEKIGGPLFPDVQFLSSKVSSLKSAVDDLSNKKSETELKIQNLERILLESGGKPEIKVPESLLQEIKNNRKKITELEGFIKSFEALETSELGKKIEKGDVKKLYAHILKIYEEIEKRASEIDKSTPPEMENRLKKLEEETAITENYLTRQIQELQRSFENLKSLNESKFYELEGRLRGPGEPSQSTDMEINELLEKIVFLESRLKSIEKMIQEPAGNQPVVIE